MYGGWIGGGQGGSGKRREDKDAGELGGKKGEVNGMIGGRC